MHVQAMLSTHPRHPGPQADSLARCIEACFDCAQACAACADACLGEEMVGELRQCIRLDLDCADICAAAGAVVTRRSGGNDVVMRRVVEACIAACDACATECEKHGKRHPHCAVCAQACRQCEAACRDVIAPKRAA